MSECRRCEERGKTWQGSDPKCGFDEHGHFRPDNWNCATLNALRDLVDEVGVRMWCDDSNAAILAEPEHEDGRGGGFVFLEWYKNRGRTEVALLCEGQHGTHPLMLKDAERVLVGEWRAHPHPYVGQRLEVR